MSAPIDEAALVSAEEAQRRARVYREFAARYEAEYAALPPGDMHRPGLSVYLDEARDNVRVMETIIELHVRVAEQRAEIGAREVSLSTTIARLRAEKAALRTQVDVLGDTAHRIADAWNQIAGHFLVSPSPANAERIARLACVAADVRDEAIATRDEAVADLARLRAEHVAALATARREGRDAALRECLDIAMTEGSTSVIVTRIHDLLPLDAPGGGS